MNNYEVPVKKELFNKAMLMLMNFRLNLTEFEIDIISILLDHNLTLVDPYSKEIIRLKLDKGKFSTNNYIKRLKDKGIFVRNPKDGLLYLSKNITDLVSSTHISFDFQLS